MKILVIDDSDYKVEHITELVHSSFREVDCAVARSFNSGVSAVKLLKPDLIILDISLPTFDVGAGEHGGRMRPYGGREILREVKRIGFRTQVIVVTQFDQFGETRQTRDTLMGQLHSEFTGWIVGGVYYSGTDSRWREELVRLLTRLKTL